MGTAVVLVLILFFRTLGTFSLMVCRLRHVPALGYYCHCCHALPARPSAHDCRKGVLLHQWRGSSWPSLSGGVVLNALDTGFVGVYVYIPKVVNVPCLLYTGCVCMYIGSRMGWNADCVLCGMYGMAWHGMAFGRLIA